MYRMPEFLKKRCRAGFLPILLSLSIFFSACGAPAGSGSGAEETPSLALPDTVSIASTNPLLSLNPFLMDASEIMKYATSLAFLPLVDLNENNEFVYVLAKSVETEDKLTYTIKLDPEAVWSDGEAVSSEDLAFTILRLTAEGIGNTTIAPWAPLDGLDSSAHHADSDTSLPGVVVVDDKTLQLVFRSPMQPNTVLNSLLRYLQPVPRHKLADLSVEELRTTDWFQTPDVVSGPYRSVEVDTSHYVVYRANEAYWRGKPRIPKLVLRLYTDGAALLPALKSGELDFVQQTLASFPQADLASLEDLANADVQYDKPLTNQLLFINTKKFPDQRIRKAIQMAINRPMLLENFLNGHGEVVDGFINSSSLYTHGGEVASYDPGAARALVEESGWDRNQVLDFRINSGDPGMVLAADVIVNMLAEIGIKAQVRKMDLNNLLESAGKHDFDLLAVQYTLAPVDPYPDVAWLTTGENWSLYQNREVEACVAALAEAKDEAASRELYARIDQHMAEDVPMINLYVISAPGVVSKRLRHARALTYGSFLNIHEWTIGGEPVDSASASDGAAAASAAPAVSGKDA